MTDKEYLIAKSKVEIYCEVLLGMILRNVPLKKTSSQLDYESEPQPNNL
jgi:hypothetical protein